MTISTPTLLRPRPELPARCHGRQSGATPTRFNIGGDRTMLGAWSVTKRGLQPRREEDETARLHHASRRLGARLAARRPRAAERARATRRDADAVRRSRSG